MIQWYRIYPTGPVSISNFAPVGQNSGQVACRWPPNGHHLAACLQLPQNCQLLGPFWHRDHSVFVTLPLPVYRLVTAPKSFYRQQYNAQLYGWEVQAQHQDEKIEVVGGRLSRRSFFNSRGGFPDSRVTVREPVPRFPSVPF